MAESFTHKYIPRIEQRENNLFVEEYYSSTDTKIILDGVEQTEIGYISYALQEQLKPLYGYASRTYDEVAVGNRIVTGVFKVPIKNPNAQTQMSEIVQSQSDPNYDEEVNDYNAEEDKLQQTIEWIDKGGIKDIITNGGGVYHPDAEDADNERYIYINKMQDLGLKDRYGNKITMQSSEESIKSAIQVLQSENGIDNATGELTEQTKDLIDAMLFDQWEEQEAINLPMGTKIYLGPGTDYDYSTLYVDQEVYVVDKSINDWWQVKLKDGNVGWIEVPGGDE